MDNQTLAQRRQARVDEVKRRMMVEGSHILCGHPYTHSSSGSRVLAPILAKVALGERYEWSGDK